MAPVHACEMLEHSLAQIWTISTKSYPKPFPHWVISPAQGPFPAGSCSQPSFGCWQDSSTGPGHPSKVAPLHRATPGIHRSLVQMILAPVHWKDEKFYNPLENVRGKVGTGTGKMQKRAALIGNDLVPILISLSNFRLSNLSHSLPRNLILWETCDKPIRFLKQPFLVIWFHHHVCRQFCSLQPGRVFLCLQTPHMAGWGWATVLASAELSQQVVRKKIPPLLSENEALHWHYQFCFACQCGSLPVQSQPRGGNDPQFFPAEGQGRLRIHFFKKPHISLMVFFFSWDFPSHRRAATKFPGQS